MKILVILALFVLFLLSCKKSSNEQGPQPTLIVDSTTFKITNIAQTDLNEFNISYYVLPPLNETYSDIYLQWSTTNDFTSNKDSISISTTPNLPLIHNLTGLKQATKYYGRISVIYKGENFFSEIKQWTTDTFKIITTGYYGTKRGLNKRDTTLAVTNFKQTTPSTMTDTKVFVGPYECPVVRDEGNIIFYSVPTSIPTGIYTFRIRKKGIEAQTTDSTEILRGKWSSITRPDIPINPIASASGLVFFGTCSGQQKGYIIGGIYFNGPPVGFPNSMYPEYIFEFDGQTRTWIKKYPQTLHYFQDPICYYYNNSIYVIAGHEWIVDQFNNINGQSLKKMLRLDLGSMAWTEMDSLPYSTMFNLTSFELNNEWYIGMGADSANRSSCCSTPLPSKKFWKYSPVTNQWTRLSDFPGGHQNFPTCFSIGQRGYAFYGAIPIGDPITSTDFSRELWEYNPSTNSWTNIPLPTNTGPDPGEKYQIISYNNKAYFLTSQRLIVTGLGYDFISQVSCLEWDPINPAIFKNISFPSTGGYILKQVFKNNNNFFFQSDALGYFSDIPNKSFSFSVEQ
jgi:hypothetical protein